MANPERPQQKNKPVYVSEGHVQDRLRYYYDDPTVRVMADLPINDNVRHPGRAAVYFSPISNQFSGAIEAEVFHCEKQFGELIDLNNSKGEA